MSVSSLISYWLILLFLSLFFSGMETVFLASDRLRFAMTQKKRGLFNLMLNTVYGHPRHFLATLIFGNLTVLVFFVFISSLILDHVFDKQPHRSVLLNNSSLFREKRPHR
jgi:putative hemolysin